MIARFGNTEYRFESANGKPVYVPSAAGRKIAKQLLKKLKRRFEPDPFFYHLHKGGHVAALHIHRQKKYFARLDLQNFFYTISRNRIARALQQIGIPGGEFLAKWSTVKNQFAPPAYALPYGFVQSPMLASLVLSQSAVGEYLREIDGLIVVSVYVDDISISGNNKRVLQRAYRKIRRKIAESNFVINEEKSFEPALAMDLFNCHLERYRTAVTAERREQFYGSPRSPQSQEAFEQYCLTIEAGNRA